MRVGIKFRKEGGRAQAPTGTPRAVLRHRPQFRPKAIGMGRQRGANDFQLVGIDTERVVGERLSQRGIARDEPQAGAAAIARAGPGGFDLLAQHGIDGWRRGDIDEQGREVIGLCRGQPRRQFPSPRVHGSFFDVATNLQAGGGEQQGDQTNDGTARDVAARGSAIMRCSAPFQRLRRV